METKDITARVAAWYSDEFEEATRLTDTADGRLEMIRTRELLHRHLPPAPAKVLDVGGGPGAHAEWLTAEGYTVHLVDPVARHTEQAAERAGCSVEVGDARELAAPDTSVDVALLLGPLYHLPDRTDRIQALAEARRVVRPGGLVVVAAINRYASFTEHTARATLTRIADSVSQIVDTGFYDGARGFTVAKFHTAAELTLEMAEAGLPATRIYSVEGPMWGIVKAVELRTGEPMRDDDPLMLCALEAARRAEQHPELLAASSHLLAISQR
ncbi:class I SAM-dependent methyltransferase [Streptacidiphilus fuscans]|uniref:Methyltransferase domain-containing protein n=1 Tax=Streptacidiphilus fuscans TaxID=2789292 RepID=A0A931B614_9ACTN|nr:class I SAM-dependent methyltransferase [Streptacidiphilus fuscans]MBF9071875.1 methyltransferase domain-containing protein [Streptacidiphilus fuscans]